MRFLHTSDWQLGMTRAFFTPEASARFSQARIDAIATLGRLAAAHQAKFIVVAGDVFESSQISRETLVRTLEALKQLPVPVFLLPGNHDPLDGAAIFSTKEFRDAPEHVIVIRDQTPIPVPGAEGVEVVGAPWRTRHPNADLCAELAAALDPAPAGVTRIAVCHGQTDNLSPDLSQPAIIGLARAETALREGRFHYLALGDRHSVTPMGETGRVWYSGAPVATDFVEEDPNQALLVDADAGRCEVTPLAVGDWHFVAEHFTVDEADDVERFRSWLDDLPGKERTAVKVGFTGSVNLATAGALDEVMETRRELFASLRLRERTTDLAVVPDELDQDSVSLAGYAKATWDELLAQSKEGDETAGDALRLLYRLSRTS
ncbi:metallophosphoesterase family protein [Lentisalinibacter orientalis]|uniref:metallophosphoesterase family protein n=1 Tax=Lentisalinibacter orientalis TaxID=2992241 RepID=UPI00386F6416